MPAWLIPAAMGIGQTMASIMTNKTNRKYAEIANKQNLANQQALIKQQNDYNSPKAQMERYKEAGLNPHLIYSQGAPGLQAQVSTPQLNYPNVDAMQFGNLSNSMQFGSKMSQYDAMIDNYRSMIARRDIDTKYLDETMENRKAILAEQFTTMFNNNSFKLAEFEKWAMMNGFKTNVKSGAKFGSSMITNSLTWSSNSDDFFESKVMQAFDQTLQRVYESTEAIKRDNVLRDLKIELENNGISSTGTDILNTLLRIFVRLTGINLNN